MSYEVYIDVRHHPKHLDEFEERLSAAGKWTEPEGSSPEVGEQMRTVAAALRDLADHVDPDWVCTHCGERRAAHHGYEEKPNGNVRCFNRYGPVTQWDWWDPIRDPTARGTAGPSGSQRGKNPPER